MESPSFIAPSGLEYARDVADAILYEGYLLYPYRRSSSKNRVRWQFGVIVPPAWAEAQGLTDTGVAGSAEAPWQQTACLLQAPLDETILCRVRFLQIQRKSVEERLGDGSYLSVDSLRSGTRLELGFDEALPQEFDFWFSLRDVLDDPQEFGAQAPGGIDTEHLEDEGGRLFGRVRRRRCPVTATVSVSASAAAGGDGPCQAHRLSVRVANAGTMTPPGASRDEALAESLIACHVLLGTDGGSFLSLLDPPRWARPAVEECVNVHTFPVLAGPPGDDHVVLSSPILLYDHPRVAPESPGDLHDATEIDEILSLRTLTLTDAEKREARATDPRAAAILDRTESMPPEVFSRLHGAVRSLRPVARTDSESPPGGGVVVVGGVSVRRGSRVRLRPRRRGVDPQDRFLDGRTALVEAVLCDVDDATHLAVTVEDDPAAELNQWYGRFRYFSPDEVEPLSAEVGP
ncbi:hypothetical protein [Actinomadura bangladeshensis]|uniref:Uncharacterized protein n=1 Tax=Actinomadura bangladeshensis TaxID=453573 RepID=A0A4R4PCR1_9ACTN|nr:hypothetical protein [Actinomadura bangladeshensis]TDC18212.1 hypothetical protein E1284_07030 [Actinomadura bangladeshensis]